MATRPSYTPPGREPDEIEDEDDLFGRRERGGSERERWVRAGVAEFLRRAVDTTVGQVQSTGSAGKEAIQYLLQQGDKGRREILRIVASEIGIFLRDLDLSQEVIKILTGVQMELNASLKFKPTGHGKVEPEPEVEVAVGYEDDLHRVSVPTPGATESAEDAEDSGDI